MQRAVQSRLVLAAVVAMIVTHVPVVMASLALPAIAPIAAASFDLPARYVGLYTALLYGTAVVATYLSPGLIDHFGPLRTSQLTLVFAAAGLLALTIGTLWALPLSAVLIGIGYAPGTPASSRLLSQLTIEGRRAGVFSIKQTSVPLGGAVAGVLAPSLAVMLGWQAGVVVLAVACLAVAAAVEPWRAQLDAQRSQGRPILRAAPIGPMLVVVTNPRLRALGLMAMAYGGSQMTFAALLVTLMVERAHLAPVEAGSILSAALTVSVAARVLWGYVANRVPANVVLAGLGGLAAAAYATALAIGPGWSWPALLALGCWYGAVGYSWNGIFLACAADAAEGRVAEATAGVMTFAFSGALVTPVLFTGLVAVGDYEAGLSVLVALVLVAAAYVGFALRRH